LKYSAPPSLFKGIGAGVSVLEVVESVTVNVPVAFPSPAQLFAAPVTSESKASGVPYEMDNELEKADAVGVSPANTMQLASLLIVTGIALEELPA